MFQTSACYKKSHVIVYVTKKTISDYGKMLKYRENIGKPIYRSISNIYIYIYISEKGQLKTILRQFSLTVLFMQSRFLSTVRFSFFLDFYDDKTQGRTCCLLAIVCLRSCHHLHTRR